MKQNRINQVISELLDINYHTSDAVIENKLNELETLLNNSRIESELLASLLTQLNSISIKIQSNINYRRKIDLNERINILEGKVAKAIAAESDKDYEKEQSILKVIKDGINDRNFTPKFPDSND